MSPELNHDALDVVIVGGGMGGMSAALRAAQNGLRALVLLGNAKTAKASRVKYVYNIDNMMGLHPSIMEEKYASLFKDNPEAQARIRAARFHLETDHIVKHTLGRLRGEYASHVTCVEKAATAARKLGEVFEVEADGIKFHARHLVLATGVADRQPIVRKKRGDKQVDGIQWVYPFANNESFLYCIRCEGHLTRGSSCAVIGFSEAAAQIALILHERYRIPVFLLTNGEELTAGEDTLRLLAAYRIAVHRSPLQDIKGTMGGRVLNALFLEDGTKIEARYAMVALGLYRVYNDLAVMLGVELEEEGPLETRHVLVDAKGETSLQGVFAVGDMTRRKDEPVMKQIYTAQEYAVRAIDAIDGRIRRQRRRAILESLPRQ